MNTETTKIALLEQSMAQNTSDHLEIKSDIKDVKNSITLISDKIDKAMECKADISDLKEVRQNQWGLVVGILLSLVGVVFSLIKQGVIK